jgi:Tfp pilus assembly protein PilX
MRDERGIVLPLTLLMMVALTALALGLVSVAAFEPVISRNLADTTQARFAADAGVEWAFNQIAPQDNWSQFLVGAGANGVTMTSGTPIGTLAAARGTFTVAVRNDTLVGDTALTGVAPEGSTTVDANKVLILTSTGGVGTSVKAVRAVLKKTIFPGNGRPPGALNFPGNEAQAAFTADNFVVDGRGYRMNGTLDAGCADHWGVAVSNVLPTNNPGGNEATVQNSLSSSNPNQKDNIFGKKQNPLGTNTGDNTIATDAGLNPTNIQNFITQAKNAADITLTSSQPSGLTMGSIGGSSNCANWASQNCWGTQDQPKIVYVKGDPDPTSNFNALRLNGPTTGYGILIVEDGDVRVYGNLNWNGIIIVTGQYVGIGFLGTTSDSQTVYGAVISNETMTDPGYFEGVLYGNAKIRYSCEALDTAFNNRKLTAVVGWKDLAPGE